MKERFDAKIPVDTYGGLCTLLEKSDLGVGLSPACMNVEFFPGGVRSRGGTKKLDLTAGSPSGDTMNIVSHTTLDGTRYVVFLDAAGNLWKFNPADSAVVTLIEYGLGLNLRMEGISFMGRLYLTFHDGKHGVTHMRQFDGTHLDPVSQTGALALPSAAEAVTGGYFSAGEHSFCIAFETRNGYVTQCTVRDYVVLVGGKGITFDLLPLGPSNVVRRRIYMSAALVPGDAGQEMFTHSSLWIEDNVTTGPVTLVGVADDELTASPALGNAPYRIPIPPCLGSIAYGNRLIVYGFQNEITRTLDWGPVPLREGNIYGLENTNFDSDGAVLRKWVCTDPSAGQITVQEGVPGAALQVAEFKSNAVFTQLGPLKSDLSTSSWTTVDKVTPQLPYKARFRAKKSSAFAPASAVLNVGIPVGGRTFNTMVKDLTTEWAWYSGTILLAGDPGGKVEWLVTAANEIPANGKIWIDSVQVYKGDEPYSGSTIMGSLPREPENFDALTSYNEVSRDDGQDVRFMFQLRGNLYALKERSLHVTTDNGADFLDWRFDQVSDLVGAFGPGCVGIGEGWVVIAARPGLYLFDGGKPEKISDEIQPLWDQIYWSAGHTIRVTVQPERKLIRLLVPMTLPLPWETGPTDTTPTAPNLELTLDYVEGFGDPISSDGHGRKWTPTRYGAGAVKPQAQAVVEWNDYRPQLLIGMSGGILKQDPTLRNDLLDGVAKTAIDTYYETAPLGQDMGRSLFRMFALKIRGLGTLASAYFRPGGTRIALQDQTLAPAGNHDIELKLNQADTQISLRVGTNAADNWWILKRLAAWLKKAPFSEVRGHNL